LWNSTPVGFDAQYSMMILRSLPLHGYHYVTNKIVGRDRILPAAADPSSKVMEQAGGEEDVRQGVHLKQR